MQCVQAIPLPVPPLSRISGHAVCMQQSMGGKNVREIATNIGMDSKEVYLALQFLLEQHRVQLYEPGEHSLMN